VPAWYVAPLEMNEGTPWAQGYNKSTRLQCRKRPKYRPLPLTFRPHLDTEHGQEVLVRNVVRNCVNVR
jgi:hypothetical protein